MIWGNPWGLLGLAAVAIPIIVHLLAQRRAERLRFPTLRFFGAAPPIHARRSRLSDVPLLLVRILIIAAAIAAIARPLFLSAERRARVTSSLWQAVIVDTSASMKNGADSSQWALTAALDSAEQLAAEAEFSTVLLTARPPETVAGATAWLTPRNGLREIVIVSDMQTGTVDSASAARIPEEMGLRLVRVQRAPRADASGAQTFLVDSARGAVTVTYSDGATQATWSRTATSDGATEHGLPFLLLGGDAEQDFLLATARAVTSIMPVVSPPRNDKIAIVFPGYEGRAELLADARAPSEAWMGYVIARAAAESLLILRTPSESEGVYAAEVSIDGVKHLAFFAQTDAGNMASAKMLLALLNSTAPSASSSELYPGRISDSVIATLQRAPQAAIVSQSDATTDMSDGRWFWLAALLLLGVEYLIRRAAPGGRAMANTTASAQAASP